MSQICSICTHPKRDEIDRALLSFTSSYRNIAQQFALEDHTCLHRHLTKHLAEEYALAKRERAERTVTTIEEIAGSLAEIMRGDVSDLFNEQGRFDIDDIRERRLGGLIKSVTIEQKRRNGSEGEDESADIIKVEMYSRLDAAKALGQMWVKLKINDDANRRLNAQRRVAEQNLQDYMSAGLSYDEAIIEVERDLPGARQLLNA
jgi:hypothetical protein